MDLENLGRLYGAHVRHLSSAYADALAAAGYDAVTIHSSTAKKRTDFDDQYWTLRPTPHFQHWVALSAADSALVIEPGRRPKLVWMKDPSFWEKPAPPEFENFRAQLDVIEVASPEAVKQELAKGRVAFVGDDRGRAASWGFDETDMNPTGLLERLDQIRTKKTDYEVLCLEEANRRAARGHDAVARAFRGGDATELELHLLYLRATSQDDPETPYKNIVALGENAATLHHVSYRKTTTRASTQSLLLDAGATFLGYCSDITRTHVKGSGAVATAFGALVAGVERLQKKLCADVAIGKMYEDLHDQSHREVAVALREAGLVSLSVDEAVATGVTRAFFPHGLGHSLGLQCHDVGCALVKPRTENPFLRNTSAIAEGQCFTIEPGIYFIGPLLDPLRAGPHAAGVDWALVGELAKMGGIRIEDDLVVTGGARVVRNLTREFLP